MDLDAIKKDVVSAVKAEVIAIEDAFRKDSVKLAEGLQKQEDEIKRLGGVVSSQDELKARQASYDQKMADLEGVLKGAASELESRLEGKFSELSSSFDELTKKKNRLGDASEMETKSAGELFVSSSAYKDFRSAGNRGNYGVNVPTITGSLDNANAKMLLKSISGDSNLRDVLSTTRLLEIMRMPTRTQRIKDLFTVFPTTQGSIQFLRESVFTNNADTVAEGAVKPETNITFTDDTVAVSTIAHWMPVTRQLLEDVTALEAYIQRRLVEGLKLVEDIQILYGSGTGADLTGILTNANINTYNWSAGGTGDTKIDAIRRAMTLARLAEYPVSAVVVNPQDWEDIELAKDTQDRYIWSAVVPGGRVEPTIWRTPVVETTAINPGDFLTGNFDMGAAIWDRSEAAVRVTDSHSDFFTRNKIVILVEERLGVTVFRPQSFIYGTFDAAPAS